MRAERAGAEAYAGCDPETGLYYYRARYYDPNMGRFVSEDPIQFLSAPNFYPYVGGSPTGATDPSGLCLVQMKYSAVKFLGMTVGYHAFIVVSNNTGGPAAPLFYRAGPGSGGSWWTPNLEALGGANINDPKLNPDWDPNAKSQTLLDTQCDCKGILGKLDDYNRRVNNSNIPYHANSTNSNAYASGADETTLVCVYHRDHRQFFRILKGIGMWRFCLSS
jgi:RHS repeat-associated protein